MATPAKIDGTSANGGLGRVKTDSLPEGVTITDAELDHYTTAQELENIKTAVIDTEARVTAVEDGVDPNYDGTVSFFDDLDDLSAWAVFAKTPGGEIKRGASGSTSGFPSSGIVILGVDATAGARVTLVRTSGLAFSATDPIVVEFALTVLNAGVLGDDACLWFCGLFGDLGDAAVAVVGDDGAHSLRTQVGGVPTDEAITLPVWTERLRIRLTVAVNGTLVEAAADAGAFAAVFTSSEAPDQRVYAPALAIERSSYAGDRVLAVDYVRGSAAREADLVGAFVDELFVHPEPLLADGTVDLTGNLSVDVGVTIDGRDLSADGAKLDGITAGAAVASVSGTAPITSTGGATPAIGISAASGSAAGSMSSADFDKLAGIEAGADVTDATNVAAALAAATANIAVNSKKITSLADGTAASDALAFGQVVKAWRALASTPQTLAVADRGIEFDLVTAGVACTLNLPTLASAQGMPPIPVRLIGDLTRAFTLARNGSDKINGVAADVTILALGLPAAARTFFLEPSPTSWVFRSISNADEYADGLMPSKAADIALRSTRYVRFETDFRETTTREISNSVGVSNGKVADRAGLRGIVRSAATTAGLRSAYTALMDPNAPSMKAGLTFEAIVEFPTAVLDPTTETGVFVIGFSNSTTSYAAMTRGIWFEFRPATSTQWVGTCTDGTPANTIGGASVVPVADTIYRLRYVINAAGTSVEFFVSTAGGAYTSIGTVATNLPADASFQGVYVLMEKGYGSATRYVNVDFVSVEWDLGGAVR